MDFGAENCTDTETQAERVGYMRPRTLSASSVHVAELCLSRYKAEMIDRGASFKNDAALLGTTVHAALQKYVENVYVAKTAKPDFLMLKIYYLEAFLATFGNADTDDPLYIQGLEMIDRWFKRTDLSDVTILSVESKLNFPLKTSIGEIPFTYIFDRFDQLGPGVYRVVDYKSSVWNVTRDNLKEKIQPRAYAVAVQMMYPDAQKIWVEFDMLRHERVGRVFTIEENRATYKYLQAQAERIIAEDRDEPPETLNSECRFCIRSVSCKAVASNRLVGGEMSIEPDEAIDKYGQLKAQRDALNSVLEKLEKIIAADSKENEWTERSGKGVTASFTVRGTRAVDAERVSRLVPPEVWDKYGSSTITMANYDKMCKDKSLSEQLRATLRGMVFKNVGEPRLKIESKVDEDDL